MSPGARFKRALVALLLELGSRGWLDIEPEPLLRSARAKQVASNVALGFKRVCRQIVKNKGAASKACVMHGGPARTVCGNWSRHTKKCACAQMPGGATFKSPHHEEYSSSDIQHTPSPIES